MEKTAMAGIETYAAAVARREYDARRARRAAAQMAELLAYICEGRNDEDLPDHIVGRCRALLYAHRLAGYGEEAR